MTTLEEFAKRDREIFYDIVNGKTNPIDIAIEAWNTAIESAVAALPGEKQRDPHGDLEGEASKEGFNDCREEALSFLVALKKKQHD